MTNKVDIRRLDSTTINDTAATALINENFEALQTAIENTLSRDGTTPNYMDADLDLNSYKIINAGNPENDHDVITKGWFDQFVEDASTAASDANAAAARAASSAQTASVSAQNAEASASAALDDALLAKDWATKMNGTVDGVDYSSKYYASQIIPIAADISTVAGIASDVTTVSGIASDVSDVADIKTDVTTVSGIASDVTAVKNNATDISAVAANETNISAVAANETNINDVNANKTNIDIVAGSISNVNTVSGSIANVNKVGDDITKVTAVADDLTSIDAVYANATNINAVNANKTNIDAVAGSISNVNAVAGNATNINTVAGLDTDVTTVAGIASDVTAVANNGTDISAVAADLTNIDAVAADLTNIDNASQYATEAKQWAIGDPTEPTGNSAKYWADYAEDIAESIGNPANIDLSNLSQTGEAKFTNLQQQIDAIVVSSDVFDVVGTYADLQAYDITTVPVNDIIKVLEDSTHSNAAAYYRCTESGGVKSWTYIGSEGPYYTKSETDTLLGGKQATLVSGTNIKTINSTSLLGAGDITIDPLPSQTGQNGKYLTTNGTSASWANVDALPSQTGQSGKYLTTDGTSASWGSVTIPTVNNATLTITQGGTTKGTFTANASSDVTIDLDSGGASRNIGEIVQSTIPLTDAGLHLLDGSLISGSGSYADFVTYIAGLVSTYPDLFETEANWQSSVTTYGVCGKFVYDSVNGTVRLPKITGFTESTIDPTVLGDLVQAGLPNITGTLPDPFGGGAGSAQWTGAFAMGSYNGSITTSAVDYDGYNITFDASRSSSIYGNSSTVQPQSIKVLYYVCIATATKTQIEVDIDEIATDLNGKADVDLSNAIPAISFATAMNTAGIRTVVETYVNGTSWYRVYSDGWCEQGGVYSNNVGHGGIYNINLLKNYSNTNYSIVCSFKTSANANSSAFTVQTCFSSKTTSSFNINYGAQSGASVYLVYTWQANGYIN